MRPNKNLQWNEVFYELSIMFFCFKKYELQIVSTPVYLLHYLFVCRWMTHFFLHGWRADIDSEKNKNFFQALCKYGNHILVLPFGLDREEEWYLVYRNRFVENNGDKKLSVVCAHRDTQLLIEQIKNSDILFFSGWKPYKHFDVINKIENFKELIKDKIVAGTSWWAIMRAQAYYSANAENCREGDGSIPVKLIAHRWSQKHPWISWEERKKLLDAFWEKLLISTTPEQEYIEFIL